MPKVEPVTMQSLSAKMGEQLAIRSCAPIAFYMLLKANDYLPSSIEPDVFMIDLDRAALTTGNGDWSRPALTQYLRHKYRAKIVSWQPGRPLPTDFPKMMTAGYIESETEIEFFKTKVEGRTIEQLVKGGFPVIATMKPGFGNTGGQDLHAVILLEWHEEKVIVVDPDVRNSRTEFKPDEVLDHLVPKGAGSIILPSDHE